MRIGFGLREGLTYWRRDLAAIASDFGLIIYPGTDFYVAGSLYPVPAESFADQLKFFRDGVKIWR